MARPVRRMAVGTDVSNKPKRKRNWKKPVVWLSVAAALGTGAAVKTGVIPNPLKGMNPLKGSKVHVSNPFRAPKSPVRVQHGDYVVISPKRAMEKVKSVDLFGTKARARERMAVADALRMNRLNPQATEVVRVAKLNIAEARALQEITAKTFGMNPDSLKEIHFIMAAKGINISNMRNATIEQFGIAIDAEIGKNTMSLANKNLNNKKRMRLERLVKAQTELSNHPNGLALARKIWGSEISSLD